MAEIRTPVETDREPMARLLARSLNSPVGAGPFPIAEPGAG